MKNRIFTVLAIFLPGLLFSFTFCEAADSTVKGGNISVTFNKNAEICSLKNELSGNVSTASAAGVVITDGKSGAALDISGGKAGNDQNLYQYSFSGNGLDVIFTAAPAGSYLSFKTEIRNTGKEQRWLYVKFSLPVPSDAINYWNGESIFNQLSGLNIEKKIQGGFPMSCLYNNAGGIALGIEPHQLFTWIDTGIDNEKIKTFRWGAKIVLDPGQKDSVEYITFAFKPEYGYANAVNVYHKTFPDLFKPTPGIDLRSIYSNCATGYSCWGFVLDYDKTVQREILRRSFCGWEWMYAPFKRPGDIFCREEYWNWGNKQADENSNFKGSPADARGRRIMCFDRAWKYNIIPMFYIVNWVEEKMSKEVFPGTEINDPDNPMRIDPWVHAYLASIRTYFWGNKFADNSMRDMRDLMKEPFRQFGGFSIDCAEGQARHSGAGMNQSPGRAYDEKGVYISEAIGEAKMMDFIHTLKRDGQTMSIVANGAAEHYQTAFRSDNYIAERGAIESLTNLKQTELKQNLVGTKPRCIYQVNYYTDKLGEQVDWKNMSPQQIRDVYRMFFKSVAMLGFKCNMYYTADFCIGSKNIIKSMPMRIELSKAGWEVITAAKTDKNIWLSRYGNGLSTYIFAGNPGNTQATGKLDIDNSYLNSMKHVFTVWEGNETENCIEGKLTSINYKLPVKEYAVYKCILETDSKDNFKASAQKQADSHQNIVSVRMRGLKNKAKYALKIPENMCLKEVKINGGLISPESAANGKFSFDAAPDSQGNLLVEAASYSTQILSPENQILNFTAFSEDGKAAASIVVPENPTWDENTAAWWIQDYFRVYCKEVKKLDVLLPQISIKNLAEKKSIMVIGGKEMLSRFIDIESQEGKQILSSDCALKIIDNNIMLIYGKTDSAKRNIVDTLMRIWDKKYIYYGTLSDFSIKGLGTVPQSQATIEMRKKAGLVGKVIDE